MKNFPWKRSWGPAAMSLGAIFVTNAIHAQALTVQPDLPSFGLVGMAPGSQFLRLNVTNLRVPGFSSVAHPGVPFVGPCEVVLSFSDGQGGMLKHSDVHLGLDQSTSLDLTASDLPRSLIPADVLSRVEILAAVERLGGCAVVPSVEVIAITTSQTNAYVLRKGGNGNGAIPVYGLAGMAPASQFIRFNMSNLPIPGASTGACEVALKFSGAAGNLLKRTELSLMLGMSTHLDLTLADLPPASVPPTRVEVLPSLVQAGKCALNSSVEVISKVTGQTNAYATDAVLSTNPQFQQIAWRSRSGLTHAAREPSGRSPRRSRRCS